MIEISKLR